MPLRIAFYGDDFTGSTDAMEALAYAGLRTALFLEPPSPKTLARYDGIEAVGVAGSSRAMSPEQMDAHLTPTFEALKSLGTPFVHYKVCSTFDSSPTVGSIGRALDIGRRVFGSPFVPIVVGAPVLGRYVVFGNLFARSGLDTEPFRLDRHPTMSRHPITPMDESDLRLHLAKQTEASVALFDALKLNHSNDERDSAFQSLLDTSPDAVLFDTFTDEHLSSIGYLLSNRASSEHPLFIVGSSGTEYALARHWTESGALPTEKPTFSAGEVERIAVVSGSCSPVTDRQIARATERGFTEIAFDTARLVQPDKRADVIRNAVEEGCAAIERGFNPILHTGRSPNDPRIEETRRHVSNPADTARLLGEALGEMLGEIVRRTGLTRTVVTGGDTSYHVARALGIDALETAAPIAPGSPLCRVHSSKAWIDGTEILFKGGQVGKIDLFGTIMKGRIT